MKRFRSQRGYRRIGGDSDSDPLSGMANLFDVAMVFAVALMVAVVTRLQIAEIFTKEDFTMVKNPGQEDMQIIVKEGQEIQRYKASGEQGAGKGKRVGTAYQLEDGKIIYVPE
ncbi:DUF2149 domain-containing protein [Poriferisphaera sp. WC338]|uniref:DUF2149 domain-containing protein n=1 Tax=Poriferisphaera sp. WC338 TaxID=3425129 RepID=UPI003D8185B4